MTKKKKELSAYQTLAAADKNKIDKKTNAGHPSDSQVEESRSFSIENKK